MKKLCVAALALALCLLLAACGGEEEAPPVELDLDSIAAALADSGQLREPLEPQDPELVAGQLSLYEDRIGAGEEDLADARFSMTLGVAADQFLLLKAADEEAADRLEAALATYAEDQRSAFEFYAPEEAHLLDDPVIERRGVYLLFAVGEDRGALAELCGRLMDGETVEPPPRTEPPASSPGPSAGPELSASPEPEGAPVTGPSEPFSPEELEAARQAALTYYAGTVFQVHGLVFEEQMGDTAGFTVQCSKGGVRQDPDRSIVLELRDGVWSVVSEGY